MEPAPPDAPKPTSPAVLRLLRPSQWVKNGFVFIPVLFARSIHRPEVLLHALAATAVFCLAASAVYCANDYFDAEKDRLHPKKRLRPVASGEIAPAVAMFLAFVLAAGALAGAFAVAPALAAVVGSYLGLNALYTGGLKNVVLLDAILVSCSFVLRVLAGSAAIGVPASHWLLLCTLLLALFLSFAKRRTEIVVLGGDHSHRPALRGYTPELLDRFASILLGACIVSYSLYTVAPETVAKFGTDRLVFGVPFVIYGLFRYLLLVESGTDAGEPGRLLFRDRPLLLCVLLWVSFNAFVIYG